MTTTEETARAAYETAVNDELKRLESDLSFRRTLKLRRSTIRALADAEAHPGKNISSVFSSGRDDVVSEGVFYSTKKNWLHHPLFREVYENVVRLTREYEEGKDARAQEAARAAWKEKMQQIAEKGAKKLETMLDFPIARRITSEDGRTIIEPTDKWSVANIAPLMRAVDATGRLALDMETDRTAVSQTIDGELEVKAEDVKESVLGKLAKMRLTLQRDGEQGSDEPE